MKAKPPVPDPGEGQAPPGRIGGKGVRKLAPAPIYQESAKLRSHCHVDFKSRRVAFQMDPFRDPLLAYQKDCRGAR